MKTVAAKKTTKKSKTPAPMTDIEVIADALDDARLGIVSPPIVTVALEALERVKAKTAEAGVAAKAGLLFADVNNFASIIRTLLNSMMIERLPIDYEKPDEVMRELGLFEEYARTLDALLAIEASVKDFTKSVAS